MLQIKKINASLIAVTTHFGFDTGIVSCVGLLVYLWDLQIIVDTKVGDIPKFFSY
jgi:hypothetical protein